MGCTRSASRTAPAGFRACEGVFAEGKGDRSMLRMVCKPEHLRKFVFWSHNLRYNSDNCLKMVNDDRCANKIVTGCIPSDETHF